jgi:tRNA(Ile)-lysidine synthase
VTTPSPRRLGGPGFGVVDAARTTIERRGMLGRGDKVLVGTSGGPDSTCLLDVLRRLSERFELDLEVAHVDHGLSDRSEVVATRVATEAARDGFEVHLIRAPGLAGPNLHARAREFRYAFFQTIAEQIGATRIATGHTLDDRVETTLARLVHGAGTDGLAGIPPVEGMRIRPLIEIRRMDTRAYCEEIGLAFDDDPANDDARFERAAIRSRLLPAVEAGWGAGAVRAIARSSERLREDAAAMSELAARLYADLARPNDEGVSFDRESFATLPRGFQRRLLEDAIGRIRDRSGGIDAALDGLAAGVRPGARFAIAGGIEISIGADDVRIRGRSTEGPDE